MVIVFFPFFFRDKLGVNDAIKHKIVVSARVDAQPNALPGVYICYLWVEQDQKQKNGPVGIFYSKKRALCFDVVCVDHARTSFFSVSVPFWNVEIRG